MYCCSVCNESSCPTWETLKHDRHMHRVTQSTWERCVARVKALPAKHMRTQLKLKLQQAAYACRACLISPGMSCISQTTNSPQVLIHCTGTSILSSHGMTCSALNSYNLGRVSPFLASWTQICSRSRQSPYRVLPGVCIPPVWQGIKPPRFSGWTSFGHRDCFKAQGPFGIKFPGKPGRVTVSPVISFPGQYWAPCACPRSSIPLPVRGPQSHVKAKSLNPGKVKPFPTLSAPMLRYSRCMAYLSFGITCSEGSHLLTSSRQYHVGGLHRWHTLSRCSQWSVMTA